MPRGCRARTLCVSSQRPAAMSRPDPAVGRPACAFPESIQEGGATVLDVRALPAPEPLVRALSAADALSPGGELTVLTPMLPVPLLQQLLARGLRAQAELLDDGSARVRVRRP